MVDYSRVEFSNLNWLLIERARQCDSKATKTTRWHSRQCDPHSANTPKGTQGSVITMLPKLLDDIQGYVIPTPLQLLDDTQGSVIPHSTKTPRWHCHFNYLKYAFHKLIPKLLFALSNVYVVFNLGTWPTLNDKLWI